MDAYTNGSLTMKSDNTFWRSQLAELHQNGAFELTEEEDGCLCSQISAQILLNPRKLDGGFIFDASETSRVVGNQHPISRDHVVAANEIHLFGDLEEKGLEMVAQQAVNRYREKNPQENATPSDDKSTDLARKKSTTPQAQKPAESIQRDSTAEKATAKSTPADTPKAGESKCYQFGLELQEQGTSRINRIFFLIPWHLLPAPFNEPLEEKRPAYLGKSAEEELNTLSKEHRTVKNYAKVYLIDKNSCGKLEFRDARGKHYSEVEILPSVSKDPTTVINMAKGRRYEERMARLKQSQESAGSIQVVQPASAVFLQALSNYLNDSSTPFSLYAYRKLISPAVCPDWYREKNLVNKNLATLFIDHFNKALGWVHLFSSESLIIVLNLIGFAHSPDESTESPFYKLYNLLYDLELASKNLLTLKEDSTFVEGWLIYLEDSIQNFKNTLPPLEEKPVEDTGSLSKGQKKRLRNKKKKQPPINEVQYHHKVAEFFEAVLQCEDRVEILKQLSSRRLFAIFDRDDEKEGIEYAIQHTLQLKTLFLWHMLYTHAEQSEGLKRVIHPVCSTLHRLHDTLEKKDWDAAWEAAKNIRSQPFFTDWHQFIQDNDNNNLVLFCPEYYCYVRFCTQLLDLTNTLSKLLNKKEEIQL